MIARVVSGCPARPVCRFDACGITRASTLTVAEPAMSTPADPPASVPPSAPEPTAAAAAPTALKRELGVFNATLLGFGSILGTGVFVALGIGAGIVGPAVIIAAALAGGLAACNAFNSAQLAAAHPTSGGTYEYGYTFLHPVFGFSAGWLFLCAKSASAATAALGFAGYAALLIGGTGAGDALVPAALGLVVVLTILAASGLRRSATANVIIVSVTLASLLVFVIACLTAVSPDRASANLAPFIAGSVGTDDPLRGVLFATAVLFVAYTGYGRLATLGEEVREPARTIPRAIIVTLGATALLYVGVAAVAVAAVGAEQFAGAAGGGATVQAAPLEAVAAALNLPTVQWIMGIGAVTAMTGVLLNLILGLSRVLLAMGRRGDMPTVVARLNRTGSTPVVAVSVVGAIIAGLVLIGDLRTTWEFSAFTVLIYYAVTNLAALRLPREKRRYPRSLAVVGLIGCLLPTPFLNPGVVAAGLAVIGVGLLWFAFARLIRRRAAPAAAGSSATA
jgi:APA family basic amino acid/polyamine antiporter